MKKVSIIQGQTMTPTVPTEYIYTIKRTLIKLNDSVMGLNFLFGEEKSGFEYGQVRSRETNFNSYQTSIVFQLSRSQLNYFRQVDTIFDLLANLGGLFSALSLISASIVKACQFNGGYQFVMNNLFTDVKRDKFGNLVNDDLSANHLMQHVKAMNAHQDAYEDKSGRNHFMRVLLLNLQTFVCPAVCLNFCRVSRKRRLLAKSYRHTLDEMSITRIIKQLRVLKAAARQMCTASEWQSLK